MIIKIASGFRVVILIYSNYVTNNNFTSCHAFISSFKGCQCTWYLYYNKRVFMVYVFARPTSNFRTRSCTCFKSHFFRMFLIHIWIGICRSWPNKKLDMLGATKLANAVSNHFLKKAFVEGFKTILKPTDFVG